MRPTCPSHQHVSRRMLLKGTVATAGGAVLNWGTLFHSRALAEQVERGEKRCILLWMNGGASQFETFDMKPGRPTGGPFRPIATKLPGVQVCELLPKISQQMDKLAVIRSMHTSQVDHPGGIHLMHTAYSQAAGVRFPELGAVLAKYLGRESSDLPSFVKVSSQGNSGSGFLGPRYQPFSLNHDGRLPPFSRSTIDSTIESRRSELRNFLEHNLAQTRSAEPARIHRETYDAARRLQGVLDAFDIEDEWEKHRELYGDTRFGRRCMLARQLIERGVPFVEVGQSGYDTHSDNFTGHRGLLAACDLAWAGLLVDLQQRGLLDHTLVVWMGEIGRTPRINNRDGRDHFVRAWSTALAGAGIQRGAVYGSTNEDGTDVAENPVTEGDFFATIYKSLGIDPGVEHYVGVRPIPIAPFGSKVLEPLLV